MNPDARNNYYMVWMSFAVAMILNLLPLPKALELFWPDWVAMALIYWIVAIPHRVGILTAWLIGLFIDALEGSVLGLHALSFSIMAYFSLLLYQRIRLFPRVKQALVVALLIGVQMLLTLWLKNLTQPIERTMSYWLPLMSNAILWPWVFILLRDLRRQFRIN
ncbi:rod shape-determining protein MreD [Pleionea sp. CnH1-48]|uniref:rod shape-determining protein MreD n=1 Tax=Pleionea sp. CnH1-48 TaxID=2954494 RepID=UPI0020983D5B|nr:rod shape-determining protein MreD [Pleionea sp. CnH1-48]MCO7224060.1 rod shape-determining protein MreD [Pleionea sp. CnH1-48]